MILEWPPLKMRGFWKKKGPEKTFGLENQIGGDF